MSSFDETIELYARELESKVIELEETRVKLLAEVAECHRQIAILQDQLRHFYL